MPQIPALSIRQPWAHAIVHLGKDVENRSRSHPHRGPVLIHASAGMTPEEYADAVEFIDRACARTGVAARTPSFGELLRGGIIGVAEMTDCVQYPTGAWWMGPRGYVLRNARSLPFIACRGTVTPLFWTPPPDITAKVTAALRA
jgi:hypothetical protein